MKPIISWIHFGDLHIRGREDQNYIDFTALLEEANSNMATKISFALLPGDNADDGEEEEYQLVREAIAQSRFPIHAITGDHDMASGRLDLFRKYLSPLLYKSFTLGQYRFLCLHSVAQWNPPVFGLGKEQIAWLREELKSCGEHEYVVAFMHAYPSEHGDDAATLKELFGGNKVLLVEMGHTHYNELANDGHLIYATTRSTGQIQEGSVGFSVTTLDDRVVSWKFKPIGEWPLVMITSPADERLITDSRRPDQLVRGEIQVRARVWGKNISNVILSIEGQGNIPMQASDECTWWAIWNSEHVANGVHTMTVHAYAGGQMGSDSIRVLVHQQAQYKAPVRREADHENALGKWPEKHILGTQLGPNKNGHPWPPRRERGLAVE
jgi:3',5'-cyclic-AMP phosphodiesterase